MKKKNKSHTTRTSQITWWGERMVVAIQVAMGETLMWIEWPERSKRKAI